MTLIQGEGPDPLPAGGRPRVIGPDVPEVGEKIIQAIHGRNTPETAAALAGVNKNTLNEALRLGARYRDGRLPEGTEITRTIEYIGEFYDRFTKALAEAEADTILRIGRGGTATSVETRTTRKIIGTEERDGHLVPVYAEEVTTIERPPDLSNLRWIAARRWRDWSEKSLQEVSGPEGKPVEVQVGVSVQAVLDKVAAVRARHGQAIDTTGSPTEGPAPV